jgi:hypothetical protein
MRITAASIPTLCMPNLHSFSSLGHIYALFAFYHLGSVYLHVQLSFMFRHPIYIVRVVATIRASSYYSSNYRNIRHIQAIVRVETRRVQSQFVVSRCSPSKMPPNIRRICAMSALSPRSLPPALRYFYDSFIQWYGTATSNYMARSRPLWRRHGKLFKRQARTPYRSYL